MNLLGREIWICSIAGSWTFFKGYFHLEMGHEQIEFDDDMALDIGSNTQFYDSFYNTWFKEIQSPIKYRLGSLKFMIVLIVLMIGC